MKDFRPQRRLTKLALAIVYFILNIPHDIWSEIKDNINTWRAIFPPKYRLECPADAKRLAAELTPARRPSASPKALDLQYLIYNNEREHRSYLFLRLRGAALGQKGDTGPIYPAHPEELLEELEENELDTPLRALRRRVGISTAGFNLGSWLLRYNSGVLMFRFRGPLLVAEVPYMDLTTPQLVVTQLKEFLNVPYVQHLGTVSNSDAPGLSSHLLEKVRPLGLNYSALVESCFDLALKGGPAKEASALALVKPQNRAIGR